jgi:excisionase family DNA binding protein
MDKGAGTQGQGGKEMSDETNSTSVADDQLLLLPEVAAKLRCCVKTVRRLITEGKLRSTKPRGRLLVRASDLHALIQATTH